MIYKSALVICALFASAFSHHELESKADGSRGDSCRNANCPCPRHMKPAFQMPVGGGCGDCKITHKGKRKATGKGIKAEVLPADIQPVAQPVVSSPVAKADVFQSEIQPLRSTEVSSLKTDASVISTMLPDTAESEISVFQPDASVMPVIPVPKTIEKSEATEEDRSMDEPVSIEAGVAQSGPLSLPFQGKAIDEDGMESEAVPIDQTNELPVHAEFLKVKADSKNTDTDTKTDVEDIDGSVMPVDQTEGATTSMQFSKVKFRPSKDIKKDNESEDSLEKGEEDEAEEDDEGNEDEQSKLMNTLRKKAKEITKRDHPQKTRLKFVKISHAG